MSKRALPPSIERIAAATLPMALHDAQASKRIELKALAASAPHALMSRAGIAVAKLALAVAPQARAVAVVAGPGNNGGDGLVAATHLHRQGLAVRVLQVAPDARMPADAGQALADAQSAGVPIEPLEDLRPAEDLVIDAVLGLGTSRAPEGAVARAIDIVERRRAAVLAIDLPSGLHPDTGMALGPSAVHARWTLSLLTLKPGLFTGAGRDHAGEVWLDRLGVDVDDEPASALLGSPPEAPPQAFGARRHAQHKGSFGDLCIVGGAPGMHGAAWLAGTAALTAGAGRVYVSPLDPQAPSLLTAAPELMQRPEAWLWPPRQLAQTTIVCGCGGGSAVAAALPALLSHGRRLVLDADALNAIASDSSLRQLLRARAARQLTTVLTPHPLEAARLLDTDSRSIQADRLGAARALAQSTAAVVVLKGSGSVLARPDGSVWINGSGNALLASAGTGDVLAGWLGGIWSQLEAGDDAGAWLAARAAVWLHGRAADRCAATQGLALPLRASQLIEAMRAALPA